MDIEAYRNQYRRFRNTWLSICPSGDFQAACTLTNGGFLPTSPEEWVWAAETTVVLAISVVRFLDEDDRRENEEDYAEHMAECEAENRALREAERSAFIF